MLAILLDKEKSAATPAQPLANLLTRYGIDNILSSTDAHDVQINALDADAGHVGSDDIRDVVLIRPHPGISGLAIRRLTLNTVRLPSHLAVWDDSPQPRLVAARVPVSSLRRLRLHDETGIEQAVRALSASGALQEYSVHEFVSADVLRIGGSFSKSGVRKHFLKQASGRGAIKLRDEVEFYRQLPETLRHRYPELLFHEYADDRTTFGVEYKAFPNLRDLLLNLQITPAQAAELLRSVLEYEYGQAYLAHAQPVPDNYLQDYHFNRVWRRIALSAEMDPMFKDLIATPWLHINGRYIPNLPAMLYALERNQAAQKRLLPNTVSRYIHADLHLENILCDLDNGDFWLVDPHGYPVCDIYYDLGKLAHSYNSHYDLLHEGRHESHCHIQNSVAHIDFRFNSGTLVGIYRELNERMRTVVHELLGERDTELRVRFNEAMHFSSDMPFHIHSDATPSVAVPIYATGALLLVEVLEELDIDPLSACAGLHSKGLERLREVGGKPWCFER
ncbi:hypothetical protein [Luteimonas panaciterrae]|uniref:hypothetical protein n=1 Tax=Luteimonas panaciterrae TaxID=363885 RepID=UPI001CFA397E|nr:hypothetical protein [Luteimonas panaciterrae]